MPRRILCRPCAKLGRISLSPAFRSTGLFTRFGPQGSHKHKLPNHQHRVAVKQARAEHKARSKQGCATAGVKPARKLQDSTKPDHYGKEQCRGGFRRKNNGQTGQRRRNIRLRRRSCQSKYRQC